MRVEVSTVVQGFHSMEMKKKKDSKISDTESHTESTESRLNAARTAILLSKT